MKTGTLISYKELRKINPEAARRAVLEYLRANKDNISLTAKTFGITRPVVYNILRKEKEGDLTDRSKAPKTCSSKTPQAVEEKVIEIKNRTRLGAKRLSKYLSKYENTCVPYGTIRHILARNRDQIKYLKHRRFKHGEKREFIDWYSAKPFEIVQMDIKHIRDQKALSKEQLIHLDRYDLPNYQWGALDVNSRFKMVGYSREKTWTNGLCWYLWVISFLRANGISCPIVFTVDNGEEFGGQSWLKVRELRKLISGFGCKLIQNHKGHPEENSQLERSHRTDDDEFYIPRILSIKGEEDLLKEAFNYIYYYDNIREHSSLDDQTPFACMKSQLPEIDDNIRYPIPILLDKVSVQLGPWSGYHVLAQNLILLRKKVEAGAEFKIRKRFLKPALQSQ